MTDLTPRQREALETACDISVNAGAGTGKTRVLVERYIRALDEDPTLTPGAMLALTFTDKAAAEMRERLRKEVRVRADAEGGRWEPMLSELEGADISTIHSFCMRLLRDDPVTMGLDPEMGVLTEMGSEELLSEVLSDIYMNDGPASASVRRLIVDLGQPSLDRTIRRLLKERGRLVEGRGFDSLKARSKEAMRSLHEAAVEGARKGLANIIPELRGLALARCPRKGDTITRVLDDIRPVLAGLGSERTELGASDEEALMDGLYRVREKLLTKAGSPRAFNLKGSSKDWGGELARVRQSLMKVANFIGENLTALRFMDGGDLSERAQRRHDDLLTVLTHVDRALSRRKRERNLVDFDDQIEMALRMLEDNSNGVTDRLRSRYRHIMVDEFQDTDPRQWRIVSQLWDGSGPAKLFVVGDPKQSIYGFRSADVRLFNKAREVISSSPKGRDVTLDTNFRSKRELVSFVNAIFPHIFSEGGGPGEWGVEHDPLDAERGSGGSVTVVRVVGRNGAEEREGAYAVETIRKAVGKWTVEDSDGTNRPMRYSDVAILLPNRIRSRHYEDALRSEAIPFQSGRGKGLFDRQEVKDVLDLFTYLMNPNDGVALLSVLKGPFFSIGDEELVRVSMSRGQSFEERLRRSGHGRTVDLLEECRRTLLELPPVRAIEEVLDKVGAYALSGGRRGNRNIDRLIEWAAAQRTDEGIFDVVRTLRSAVESPPMEGESPFSPDSDAVSIMTVHAAKGLEWPLVMVLGLHHGHRKESGDCMLDPERGLGVKVMDDREGDFVPTPAYETYRKRQEDKAAQERRRLLYVACTRAKDHLVLSGVSSDPKDGEDDDRGCMALLLRAMGADDGAFSRGCFEVGGTSVAMVSLGPNDVRPLMEGEQGKAITDQPLSDEDPFRFLGEVGPTVERELLNPTSNEVLRQVMAEMGLTPSAVAPTKRERPPLDVPTPRKIGDMVHSVMMGADPARVASEHGHAPLANEIGRKAAILREKVRAFGPVREWRELEVCTTIRIEGLGSVRMMGRMDLVLELKDGSYLVVDYKTGEERPEYLAQLEVYKRMLSTLVSGPVDVKMLKA